MQSQMWQDSAWIYNGQVPILGFSHDYVRDSMARVRPFPAIMSEDPNEPPMPLTKETAPDGLDPAMCDEILQRLAPFPDYMGQTAHKIDIAGEVYVALIKDDTKATGERCQVLSNREMFTFGGDQWRIRETPDDSYGVALEDGTPFWRLWTPDPEFSVLPFSHMVRLNMACEQLLLLNRLISAVAKSRIAQSGKIIAIADEFELESATGDGQAATDDAGDGELPSTFFDDFVSAGATAIMDPESAAAVMNLVVRGPHNLIKDGISVIDVTRTMEDALLKLRQECREEIATGVNLPREIPLGVGATNHWNAEEIRTQAWQIHLEPRALAVCAGTTAAFYRPSLLANKVDPDIVRRCLVWYDPQWFLGSPDLSEHADEALTHFAISLDAYRRARGWSPDDAPTDAEIKMRLGWQQQQAVKTTIREDGGAGQEVAVDAPSDKKALPAGKQDDPTVDIPHPDDASAPPESAPATTPAAPKKGAPAPAATPKSKTGKKKAMVAAGGPVEDDEPQTGVMVALMVPPAEAQLLADLLDDDPAEMHVTLAYLGHVEDLSEENLVDLFQIVEQVALGQIPMDGVTTPEVYEFGSDPDERAVVVQPFIPGVYSLHAQLVRACEQAMLPVSTNFAYDDYKPHITLGYIDSEDAFPYKLFVPTIPMRFSGLTIRVGDRETIMPFTGLTGPRVGQQGYNVPLAAAPRGPRLDEPITAAGDFDEDKHPRDNHGRFGNKDEESPTGLHRPQGYRTPAQFNKAVDKYTQGHVPPSTSKPGDRDNPIKCGADIDKAAELIQQGKAVQLDQPDQVSTLLDKLAQIAQEAKDAGTKAPDYNLCNVSVPGTNLFCSDNIGRDRDLMPQFSGRPIPGTPADALPRDKNGEVNASEQFVQALSASGVKVEQTDVLASHLRASQDQLVGTKVGGMMRAIEAGTMTQGSIFTTSDNYVLDGHHRWAATIGADAADGHLGDISMPVQKINMDIGSAITFANDWVKNFGIAPKGTGVTASAGAARPLEDLGARVVNIERDTRNRLLAAAEATVEAALKKAGMKVRNKMARQGGRKAGAALVARFAHIPPSEIAAAVGRQTVEAYGLNDHQLLEGALSDLQVRYLLLVKRAQQAAAQAAAQAAGHEDDYDPDALDEQLTPDRNAGWALLAAGLTGLVAALLYDPHPSAPEHGEYDESTVVPLGLIRASLSRAGGAPEGEAVTVRGAEIPTTVSPVAGSGPVPGGATAGPSMLDQFRTQLGITDDGYQWKYGEAPRSREFLPHKELDGQDFASWDDDILANSSGWPDYDHYFPQDHNGCGCDAVFAFTQAGERTVTDTSAVDDFPDTFPTNRQAADALDEPRDTDFAHTAGMWEAAGQQAAIQAAADAYIAMDMALFEMEPPIVAAACDLVLAMSDRSLEGHVDTRDALYRLVPDPDGSLSEMFAPGGMVGFALAPFDRSDRRILEQPHARELLLVTTGQVSGVAVRAETLLGGQFYVQSVTAGTRTTVTLSQVATPNR